MRHKVKQVHFVGIGGAGMSGIAEVLLTLGYKVSGSDLAESAATRRLRQLGAKIHIGHAEEQIAGADAVVVSTAVTDDNPEVVAARARKIPVVPRALMLAELMRLKQGIAVAGTHGKTTTTSLVASVLAEGGLDPTFVIGGRLEAAGSNARLGAGEFIVVEADESDASFLYLQPVLAVVTNIDADHMETYDHSLDKLRQAFVDFLQHLPFYGVAVLCIDDPNVRVIMPQLTKPITTYGLVARRARARASTSRRAAGRCAFACVRGERRARRTEFAVTLNLPGRAQRAQRARGDRGRAGVGVRRRRSRRRSPNSRAWAGASSTTARCGSPAAGSFTLIDDYGHHPAEMAATLAAARGAFPGRRLLLAFQPHRYTRTRDCFEDFVKVLSTADALVLTEVYPGRRGADRRGGRPRARARRCGCRARSSRYSWRRSPTCRPRYCAAARDGDVVLTMGAGSIGGVAPQLASTRDGA